MVTVVLCVVGCGPERGTEGGPCRLRGGIFGSWYCDDGLICVEDIDTCRRVRSASAGEPCNWSEWGDTTIRAATTATIAASPGVCAEGLSCQSTQGADGLPVPVPAPCDFHYCCEPAR